MNNPSREILLVDDDISFLKIFSQILQNAGYQVTTMDSGKEALELIGHKHFKVILTDYVMPECNGMDLLNAVIDSNVSSKVVMLTGDGSIAGAVDAMRQRAFTYLEKPIEIDQLLIELDRAFSMFDVEAENTYLKLELNKLRGDIIPVSSNTQMQEVYQMITASAKGDSNILVTGESGTGKEIVADMLHTASSRCHEALIKINCAAIPETLFESELFGHEKGAFTGAVRTHQGKIERADGGTLFLDEISEMPISMQAKLLRILQERRFERLGGTVAINSDFRLIAATNQNMQELVSTGRFREDLYYRLNVIEINIPPLRDRPEDIIMLAEHFIRHFSVGMNKNINGLTSEANDALLKYTWPGNIRELKNIMERAVVFEKGPAVSIKNLPKDIQENDALQNTSQIKLPANNDLDYRRAKTNFEKAFLNKALAEHGWNISQTAETIGIARKNLQLKIKELSIHKKDS